MYSGLETGRQGRDGAASSPYFRAPAARAMFSPQKLAHTALQASGPERDCSRLTRLADG